MSVSGTAYLFRHAADQVGDPVVFFYIAQLR